VILIPIIIVLSIILGYKRGGSLKNFLNIEFKRLIFIFIGFIIQVIIFTSYFQLSSLKIYTGVFFIISYIIVFITIYSNFHLKSVRLIGTGFFLNFIVILFNKGYIPVSIDALKKVNAYEKIKFLKEYTTFNNCILMSAKTKLNLLGDIIPIKYINQVISIGDIIILLGFFLFIQEGMLKKN